MSSSVLNFILLHLVANLFSLGGAEWWEADRAVDLARVWCEKGLASPRCSYQRLHAFRQAAELDPGCLQAYLELGEAYYDLAIGYGHQDLFRQAAGALEAAARLDPERAQAHYRLGAIYFFLKDFERCRRELETAHRIDPSFSPAADSLRLFEPPRTTEK